MLNEDQIISKLKELKQIKPDSDWAYLTKLDVFGAEKPTLRFIISIKENHRVRTVIFRFFRESAKV